MSHPSSKKLGSGSLQADAQTGEELVDLADNDLQEPLELTGSIVRMSEPEELKNRGMSNWLSASRFGRVTTALINQQYSSFLTVAR